MSVWLASWTPSPAFVRAWIRAFVFTQLIEIPVYVWLARTRAWKAFSLTLVTHPILWFVFWLHVSWSVEMKTVIGEAGVLLVETLMLWGYEHARLSVWRALLIAALANGASYGLGELSRYFFNWP